MRLLFFITILFIYPLSALAQEDSESIFSQEISETTSYLEEAEMDNHLSEYSAYEIQQLGWLSSEELILERSITRGHFPSFDVFPAMFTKLERIQLRNAEGKIVAYTPTRMTALDFCFSAQSCYVFTWKTVYPLPSIFKLDTGKLTSLDPDPVMEYSRGGVPGAGFTGIFNPLLGLFGVFLLLISKGVYTLAGLGLPALYYAVTTPIKTIRFKALKKILFWLFLLIFITITLALITAGPYLFNMPVYVSSFTIILSTMLLQISRTYDSGRTAELAKRTRKVLWVLILIMFILWMALGLLGTMHTGSF